MIQPRLLRLAQLSRILLAFTVVQGGTVGLLAILQAWLLSHVVDRAFLGGAGISQVASALGALLLVVLGRALLAWGIEVSSATLAQRIKTHLRRDLLQRLLGVGPVIARHFNTAELTYSLSEGLDALEPYYSQFLPQLFLAVFVPLMALVAVAASDPLSALIMLLTGPLIPLFMYLIGKQAEHATQRQWKQLNQMSAYFLDVIQGLVTLKLLGRSKQQVGQIAQVSERFRQVTLEVLRITFLSALALELLSTLSTAVVAVQVGLRLLAGQMSFGTALFVLVLAPEFYLPLRLLGQKFHTAMSGSAAAGQVFGILDELATADDRRPQKPHPGAAARRLPSAVNVPLSSVGFNEVVSNDIVFTAVNFTYPGTAQPALQGVSFALHPGTITALVGPSGAGKSTVASLLLGFIRPDQGQIMVGDHTLSGLDLAEWRWQVAWLPQNPFLLNASVADNLRLARPDASMEQLRHAARLANAEEFIQGLPGGYDTQVGEGGLRLSAGQAQRLALARVFLKDAPLVILDEPAAHLDAAAEQSFLRALRALRGIRTVLVIAHRLHSAAMADQVLVLDQGHLVQSGSPQVLARQPGLYRTLLSARDLQPPSASPLSATPSPRPRVFLSPPPLSKPSAASDLLPGASGRPSPRLSSPLSFLYRQLIPFWREAGLSAILGFGVIASSVGLMAASAYLISAAALQPSIAELQVAIVGVRFFGLARGVLRYLERLVSHDVTFRLLGRLRVWFYQVLEPLTPAGLLYRQGGDLLSRITSDIALLESFYVRSAAPVFVAGLALVGLLLFFSRFSIGLAAALAGVFLFAVLPVPWLLQHLGRRLGSQLIQARARLQAGLVELIQGLPDLLVYDRPHALLGRLEALAQPYTRLQGQQASLGGLQSALTGFLAHLGMLLTLLVGIQLAASGQLPGVYLAALVLAALASFEAVQPIALAAQQSGAHRQAAARLLQIASQEPVVKEHGSPVDSQLSVAGSMPLVVGDHQTTVSGQLPVAGYSSLLVRSLSFTYPGESQPALQDISFDLQPGQQVAIVGPSGAGKTTLLHLLLRFWNYSSGEILLDGVDLRRYAPEDVRRRMAVVPQHPYLFNTTLEENLRLADPVATPDQLAWALDQAQLHDFVRSLPEGFATPLGEHGLRLSTGQRQRLAIARALLRTAPGSSQQVLLLDEPAAGLDAITERQLLDTLCHLRQQLSILMITHSLTGLQDFDAILVLQDGRVVERGTHAALLDAGGWYARHYR